MRSAQQPWDGRVAGQYLPALHQAGRADDALPAPRSQRVGQHPSHVPVVDFSVGRGAQLAEPVQVHHRLGRAVDHGGHLYTPTTPPGHRVWRLDQRNADVLQELHTIGPAT